MTPAIQVNGVTRRFAKPSGEVFTALSNVDVEIAAGSFVSIVGPSGCGKSTLLNLIAGLAPADSGSIRVYGEALAGLNRRAAYMFQQDALLPWKSVLENVALGLEFRGINRSARAATAADWIRRVGLEGFDSSYPHQLSGGMRKRAAMAQAFLVDPDILLMDEPFSALDVHTRLRMESELVSLWSGTGKTVVFVTHDLEEAIALSDEVIILSAGPASKVAGRFSVDLPRPRNLIDIKTEPRFQEVYRVIWKTLREEVLKTHV
ncbi:MAG: ABC transporter ATP-binding protein [Candidatus Solibacter usitatus]|nr:ABC transporter ATP-binding protein [Candidatus Solibacter usitatus]